MTPLYVKTRAEARLATALREYREARREWRVVAGSPRYFEAGEAWHASRQAINARIRWDTLHSLLHTPEPTWAQLRGEGYDELELRAIGGDR